MKITKEIIDCVLYSQFSEEDYDRGVGLCKTVYMVSNLFHSEKDAKYAIEKILEAYAEVMNEEVESK
jgi:hypothetical protein